MSSVVQIPSPPYSLHVRFVQNLKFEILLTFLGKHSPVAENPVGQSTEAQPSTIREPVSGTTLTKGSFLALFILISAIFTASFLKVFIMFESILTSAVCIRAKQT